MSKPRLIIETEITQHGRRKPTTLRLDLAACRQAMAELARAERILLAAAAADETADEATGEGGEDEPHPADGAPPHHAYLGEPRCEAYDDDGEGNGWLCNAQAGHGGPVHLAYREGDTILRRWAARPRGEDPYEPGTAPPCRCSHPMREHSIRLIDRSRGACTTGCGCTRYQLLPLADAARTGSLPSAREP